MIKNYMENYEQSLMLINATNAATWGWNIQTGEVIINQRWAEMIGYKLEELMPMSIEKWAEIAHPDDIKISNAELQAVFNHQKEYYSVEVRLKDKHGNWVWVIDSGTVVKWTEDGRPVIAIGTHIDITQTKELQIRYQNGEKFLSQIIENMKAIVYRLDLKGNIIYISPGWQDLLGYKQEEAINKSFHPYVHPDDIAIIENNFQIVYQTKKHFEFSSYRLKHSDGSWRYFETSASPIIENDQVVGITGVAREITERLKMEDEIKREKDLFEATIMSVGDGVIVLDNHGVITKMNKTAQTLTGYAEIEAIGKYYQDIFNVFNEDKQPLGDIISTIINTREALELKDIVLQNKQGDFLQIEDSASPIIDTQEEVRGVVIVFRDVSEIFAKQRQIEYLSYHDQLTDFYNRHYLEKIINSINHQDNYPLGIISIDINNLKFVNDNYGHIKGDYILMQAARIIRKNIPCTDFLFRIGGDEFLLFVYRTNPKHLKKIKENIINSIRLECTDNCPLSLSFGAYIAEQFMPNLYEGIKIADERMYIDKQKSKAED
ncbi:PAS domain S-box protein [Trichlorobacter sp.]|uniref:PAS domain S-box protein n=1 Tax=Trichlorobacter sp. TaxID=2911007 RepID=UPI002A359AA6|nr:PAS domain S-box protein [Trichlorobacter sp.]MDY0385512.1 PAS domain S-box protein [Trichlorobacter sp.]